MRDPVAVGAGDAAAEVLVSVCSIDDVPLGEGRAATVADRRLAVFNARAGWYALANGCPHRGGPLADGLLADRCVVCPLHERRYELATGAAVGGGEGVQAYEVVVRGRDVLVRVSRP